MGKLSGSSYFLLGWECASSEVWKQKNFAKLDLLSSSWLIDALPYLFFKGSTCCKSMQVPFCQRFCDWLPVLKEDVFFPKTVPYIIFSNGCWLHTSCHQRIYSTPFCFPNVCFFTGSLPQPFFQRLQATFFCKGCRQPFLQRLWPTFPTFATFFPKVLFWLESSPILFSKGATFLPKVAIFAQVLIYCLLDQFGP